QVRIAGGGEIRAGATDSEQAFVTTIEPFHGDQLAVYPIDWNAHTGVGISTEPQGRILLDDNLKQGHALATGDFLGLGRDQIVAGWREPNRGGQVGLKIYWN